MVAERGLNPILFSGYHGNLLGEKKTTDFQR